MNLERTRWADHKSAAFQTDQILYEYALVIYPDEEVNEKIAKEKKDFYEHDEHQVLIKTRPNIIIASFFFKEVMEEILIRWIQNICKLHPSFIVTLDCFNGFPHSIYLQVKDHQPFKKLAASLKMLDGFIQSNDCPPVFFARQPLMMISENLPVHIYEKAIANYNRRRFHESFQVEKLMLVKKDEDQKYRVVNAFALPRTIHSF